MKRNGLVGLTVFVVFCLFTAGCQKNTANVSTRRAQLVGSENVQLKKDIADRDNKIAELTKQLEQAHAELTGQIEKLKQDNASLNKQYTEFQQNHEKIVSEYQASLKTTQESLDAKPTPCSEVEEKYADLYKKLLEMLAECETKRAEIPATE